MQVCGISNVIQLLPLFIHKGDLALKGLYGILIRLPGAHDLQSIFVKQLDAGFHVCYVCFYAIESMY